MDPSRELRGFFHGKVLEALADLEIKATTLTERYLVELLTSFAAAEHTQELYTPFVHRLEKAYAAHGSERAVRMRGIGDSALFVAGFLADSMIRRGVTLTYCVAIGQRAYDEVGQQKLDSGLEREVFRELARRFEAFVHVLDEIREQTSHRTDGDLVRLYERWHLSGSPELLRRLWRSGFQVGRFEV